MVTYQQAGLDSSKRLNVVPECPCGCGMQGIFHARCMFELSMLMGRYLKVNGSSGRYVIFALTQNRELYAGIHTPSGFARMSRLQLPSVGCIAEYLDKTNPNSYALIFEEEPGLFRQAEP